MVNLDSLPNELISTVIQLVDVDDFEGLLLVSRRIYGLAQPRLREHRRLVREYSHTCVSDGYGVVPRHLPDLIIEDPYAGQYIRSLSVEMHPAFHASGFESISESCFASVTSHTGYKQLLHLIRDLKLWSVHETELPRRELPIVLLLLYAPNITFIQVNVSGNTGWQSRHSRLWIALAQAAKSQSIPVLSKLESVRLGGGGLTLRHVQAFGAIPSVRTLRIESLCGWVPGNQDTQPEQDARRSSVDALEIVSSMLGGGYDVCSASLRQLLLGFGNLTCLTVMLRLIEHHPLRTFAEVLAPISYTLRELTILYPRASRDKGAIRSLGSFVQFTALEWFETYFDGIYPYDCPASLQTLILCGKARCVYGKDRGKQRYSARVFLEAVLDEVTSQSRPKLYDLRLLHPLTPRNGKPRQMLEETLERCYRAGLVVTAPDVVNGMLVTPRNKTLRNSTGQSAYH
ncbi:MAG: hypothetical protein Q9201_000216 [Fulgogasparrea decipioides]